MGFENLDVWQKSARLSADIYRALKFLKDYGFRDQITRSGLSIPSNIAEGEERSSLQQAVNFLNYAEGSCGELKTQIYIGIDIEYIPKDLGKIWIEEVTSITKMIGALMKQKRQKIASESCHSS